jgi:hypothetical protein
MNTVNTAEWMITNGIDRKILETERSLRELRGEPEPVTRELDSEEFDTEEEDS